MCQRYFLLGLIPSINILSAESDSLLKVLTAVLCLLGCSFSGLSEVGEVLMRRRRMNDEQYLNFEIASNILNREKKMELFQF